MVSSRFPCIVDNVLAMVHFGADTCTVISEVHARASQSTARVHCLRLFIPQGNSEFFLPFVICSSPLSSFFVIFSALHCALDILHTFPSLFLCSHHRTFRFKMG